jgi:hypothetical protein
MRMSDAPTSSLIYRSVKGVGELVEFVGPWTAIPGAGPAGTLLKKMPLEEAVGWAKRAIQNFGAQRIEPSKAASEAAKSEVAEKPSVATDSTVTVSPAEEPKIIEQIAKAVRSEPFEIALSQAVNAFPTKLAAFMVRTRPLFKGSSENERLGVWPAFAIEKVARSHFREQLGSSAAASKPEVGALIENGLALEAVELLRLNIGNTANATPPGVRYVKDFDAMRVWAADDAFEWPNTGALSPGYFVAHRGMKMSSDWDAESNEKERQNLLGKLGRMSMTELNFLTNAWSDTCDTLLSPGDSDGKAFIDGDLTRLRLPVLQARLALAKRGAPEGQQQAFEDQAQGLLEAIGNTSGFGDLKADTRRAAIDLLDALGDDGRGRFEVAEQQLKTNADLGKLLIGTNPGGAALATRVHEFVRLVRELRAWS